MKLSVRTRYAVRLLLDLASHPSGLPRNASQLSENTGVPEHYIVQIMAPLKTAAMVQSIRGAGGGHALLKSPGDISIGDVFRATEGPVQLTQCCADPDACPHAETCPTRNIWLETSEALEGTLDAYSLADLMRI